MQAITLSVQTSISFQNKCYKLTQKKYHRTFFPSSSNGHISKYKRTFCISQEWQFYPGYSMRENLEYLKSNKYIKKLLSCSFLTLIFYPLTFLTQLQFRSYCRGWVQGRMFMDLFFTSHFLGWQPKWLRSLCKFGISNFFSVTPWTLWLSEWIIAKHCKKHTTDQMTFPATHSCV